MYLKHLITLTVCIIISACHTQGNYIKMAEATEVKNTITTADELIRKLGTPSATIANGEGHSQWIYEGVHSRPGVTAYIPYLTYLIGQTVQKCTQLSVTVNKDTGALDDWRYLNEEDIDYWFNTDDHCKPKP